MLFKAEQQRRQKSGASGHGVDEDVLVRGMGAVADGSEAVECGDANRGGEIAIRAATGGAFT